jgi:hypothetical protein
MNNFVSVLMYYLNIYVEGLKSSVTTQNDR